ncbi:MAG: glycosyltransferase [Chloroflexota bacterium]|nr:glycosyltransferase [Chloroflexota bacterium]
MNGISVIIPAYNAGHTLRECLQAATTLGWCGGLEIIVVNDGSSDNTSEIASSFPGVKVIDVPHGGAARATNIGIKAANHNIVVLLDADAVLEKDWLEKIISSFDDSTVAAVGGYVLTANKSIIGKIVGYDVESRLDRVPMDTDHLSTMNTACRREALLEVGLANEGLMAGYDVDLSRKLRAAGYRLLLRKNVTCRHYWKDDLRGYLWQQHNYAYHRMELARRFGRPHDQVTGLGMILQVPLTVALLLGACLGSLVSPLAPLLLLLLPLIHLPKTFSLLIGRKDACVLLLPLLFTIRNLCWVWAAVGWGIREGLKGLLGTFLYVNACYLIADIAVVSLLGFAFWTLAARLYTPAQVGLASATIAAAILLSRLSGLGFGYGLIRFLPDAGERASTLINSCFTIAGLTSLATALVFLAGLNLWSPALIYLHQPGLFIFFVFLTAAYTLFLLIDQAFIARRSARSVLFKNAAAGMVKIAAVMALAIFLSSFGIFASWGLAVFVALAMALFWFLPKAQQGYAPIPAVSKEAVNKVLHFSLGNYIAELFWFAPIMLFPLMVVNILGAETNAYFYIPWAIAQMLFAIPMAVSYSLFAEGSHEEHLLRSNTLKSLKLCLLILVPVAAVLFAVSDKLLLLFGSSYSENGAALLRILALSTIPVGINCICLGVMRVKKNTRGVMLLSASIACLALVSGYIMMTGMGLLGVGTAWIATQTLVAAVTALFLFHRHHRSASVFTS